MLNCVVWLVALPVVPACAYLAFLTLLSGKLPLPARSSRSLRFDVIVPAHDEAAVIERTVRSLAQLDWPVSSYRVRVIADNCSDATASIARSAGAAVLERRDPGLRGKGHALEYAFAASVRDDWADAIVVVDADTKVSPNLLEACATRLERGAQAIQIHYAVLNPGDSWRTRLMAIALSAFHTVRSRARSRLGLSCGIRGNGWCVTRAVLARVPYRAYSLTEDIEYGIDLGLAGIRVDYAEEAVALGEMVSAETSARKQRQRWESGRFQLIRTRTLPLLSASVAGRSAVCLDLALDLLVLPLSYVACGVLLLILVGGLAAVLPEGPRGGLRAGVACLFAIVIYVLRGWVLSGVGPRAIWDFLRVPGFIGWKLAMAIRGRRPGAWIRTDRKDT